MMHDDSNKHITIQATQCQQINALIMDAILLILPRSFLSMPDTNNMINFLLPLAQLGLQSYGG